MNEDMRIPPNRRKTCGKLSGIPCTVKLERSRLKLTEHLTRNPLVTSKGAHLGY